MRMPLCPARTISADPVFAMPKGDAPSFTNALSRWFPDQVSHNVMDFAERLPSEWSRRLDGRELPGALLRQNFLSFCRSDGIGDCFALPVS